jgi:hypothetical protein
LGLSLLKLTKEKRTMTDLAGMKLTGVILLGGGINWEAEVRNDEYPVLCDGYVLLYTL